MNSPKYEGLFLQTIFDYFHEKADWPTYRDVDQKLISIDRRIDIKEISESLSNGFANTFRSDSDLDNQAILSIEAIRVCDNSEGVLADFITAVHFFVDKYFEAKEDNPTVTGADLKNQLNMTDDAIARIGKMIYGEYMLYSSSGSAGGDGYGTWLYRLKREIRRFDGVTSIEDYLERRDKERITARQQATGQLKSFLGYMYRKPGSDNAQAGMAAWIKNLTEC